MRKGKDDGEILVEHCLAEDDEHVGYQEESGLLNLKSAKEADVKLGSGLNGPCASSQSQLVNEPEVDGGDEYREDGRGQGQAEDELSSRGEGDQGEWKCPRENETEVGT